MDYADQVSIKILIYKSFILMNFFVALIIYKWRSAYDS